MPAPDPALGARGSIPRGRHAPPLQERLTAQRRRLFDAAARVFARDGYATASAEAISREAGMSKATFYEHFANKEECLLGLFDEAVTEVLRAMEAADEAIADHPTYESHVRALLTAFLAVLARYPDQTRTVLVEIIGAGPRAARKRDEVLDAFADYMLDNNARTAPSYGAPLYASREDAFAVVGAHVELVSRQLRTGQPRETADLEDVMVRVLLGTLGQARDVAAG